MSAIPAWPEPYLQPDRTQDCGFYATAYVARCLGYADVTADDVKNWRASTGKHEDWFLGDTRGVETTRWSAYRDAPERPLFWLGANARGWLTGWLATHIAHLNVFRIPDMGHAVIALEARDDGVLLMDPLTGFVVESWDWLLGIGVGRHGCHFVSALYPLPATPAPATQGGGSRG